MIVRGLMEEAEKLLKHRHLNALNSVGYREFFDYFDGTITKEKAIELIKRNSRRYAKRQMTWWAKDNISHGSIPTGKLKFSALIDDAISNT